ncbi:MAG: LysM peptidoglycan-binding domain-containing protein [Bacteroidales bacterium]|nr:LysM peptidoglycan-binding domain-containing protein [Bacteroidales bacterium]
MKKFFILVFFFIASLAQAQTVDIPHSKVIQTRDGKQFYVHTVQRGQTVYSIAKAYNVGIDEIYYNNPAAKTGIMVGQQLYIPTVNKETEITKQVKQSNFDFFYHVASEGETIDHIASIYMIPKKYILLANPGLQGPLKEGEFVKIPVEEAYKILDGQASGEQASKPYTGGLNTNSPETKDSSVENTINNMEKTPAPQIQSTTVISNLTQVNPNSRIPIIKDYRHVVMQGETLGSIANKYKISVAELKAVNPGLTNVTRGMQLKLPVNAQVPGYRASQTDLEKAKEAFHNPPANSVKKMVINHQQTDPNKGFIVHIVKPKETLYSISRKYGVSLNDLYLTNKNLTTAIKIGQKILIPKKKINKEFVVYSPAGKIRLKKVAKLYGISVGKIKQANPFSGRFVFPGQLVKIPTEKQPEVIPLTPGAQKTQQPETAVKEEVKQPQPSPGCEPSVHIRTFKIALMVPLYLEQTDSLNRYQFMMQQERHFEPFRFIQFLQGALLATESLKAQGMNVQLYVYDVDQTLTKTSKVLSRPELMDMDLIIGPFYSQSFDEVSLFAGHFHIPIVNPLTFRESVLDGHDGIIKVKPGFNYEPQLVKQLVKEYYSKDKVFIIKPDAFKDNQTVDAFRDSVQTVLPNSMKFANSQLVNLGIAVTQRETVKEQTQLEGQLEAQKETLLQSQQLGYKIPVQKQKQIDSLLQRAQKPVATTINDTLRPYFLENKYIQPDSLKTWRLNDSTTFTNHLVQINYLQDSLHPFLDNASVLRQNLVIVYGTNKAFVMDVMNRLNVLCDTFNVKMIGVPAWETISNLDDYQMSKLNVTYPTSFYVNYTSPEVKRLNDEFVKNYGTVPEKYGFLGYDITHYFLAALYHYGKRMTTCLPNDPYKGISTKFQFVPSSQDNKSYENKYWNILRIQNMQSEKLPDSTSVNYNFQWPTTVKSNDTIQ